MLKYSGPDSSPLSLKCHFPCVSGSFPCPLEDGDTVDRHNWNLTFGERPTLNVTMYFVHDTSWDVEASMFISKHSTRLLPFRLAPPRTSAIPSWCFGRVVRSPWPWQNSSNWCPPKVSHLWSPIGRLRQWTQVLLIIFMDAPLEIQKQMMA